MCTGSSSAGLEDKWYVGLFVAIFFVLGLGCFTAGLRFRRQAQGLTTSGKGATGKVVEKRTENGGDVGVSYFLDIVFPLGQETAKQVKKKEDVSYLVYAKYEKESAVDMLYHEQDPRFCTMAELVREEIKCTVWKSSSYLMPTLFTLGPLVTLFTAFGPGGRSGPWTLGVFFACVFFACLFLLPAALYPFRPVRLCKGRDALGELQAVDSTVLSVGDLEGTLAPAAN